MYCILQSLDLDRASDAAACHLLVNGVLEMTLKHDTAARPCTSISVSEVYSSARIVSLRIG